MPTTEGGATHHDERWLRPGPGAGSYASVDDLEMYYEVHGTGRPLVLLHDAYMRIAAMGEIVPELEDLAGHRRRAAGPRVYESWS